MRIRGGLPAGSSWGLKMACEKGNPKDLPVFVKVPFRMPGSTDSMLSVSDDESLPGTSTPSKVSGLI